MDILKLKPLIKRIIKNNNEPILNSAYSDGNNLSFTDLETYIVLKNIEKTKGLLEVNSLGICDKILEYNLEDFPTYPNIKTKNRLTVSIDDLSLLLESTSKDMTRLQLNGIAWVNNDLVSTNGHIMTKIQGFKENKSVSSIMPKNTIKELIYLCKKFKYKNVEIFIDDDHMLIENSSFKIVGKLILKEYPKYDMIIPTKTTKKLAINDLVDFKTVKDILDKRTNMIKLESINNDLFFSIPKTEFSKKIGKINYSLELGFNLKYLLFLTYLDKNIGYNNITTPFITKKGNITRVAMPIRL